MKIPILFAAILATGGSVLAQAPVIQWQKSLGGSLNDAALAVRQTAASGYIVAGSSFSTDGQVTGNHGGGDYWIVKLNDTGGVEWEKSYGGSGSDLARDIQLVADGGYIISGSSNSTDGDVTGNHGGRDCWIVKINDTGGIEWQKSYGGTGDDQAHSLQQTSDGGYILGAYTSSNNGDVSGNHGSYDYWIVKLNDTGGIQWQKCMGGSGEDLAASIRQTAGGGYVVTGLTYSNDMDVSGNHGDDDIWVVRLNDTGGIVWQKCLGGSGADESGCIEQTTDGGFIIAGQTQSFDGDVSGFHGGNDYWAVKLNDTGAIEWQKCYGGSSDDITYSARQTADGGYVLGGWSGSTDGDVTGSLGGGGDYWVVRTNDTGAILWQKSMGGSGIDQANSIRQTSDGSFIVVGSSASNDLDVSGNHGVSDYWVVKLECSVHAGSISGDSVICPGSVGILSDTASGGTWSMSNGHATIAGGVMTGVSPGMDTAIYSVTNFCGSDYARYPVSVSLCPTKIVQAVSGAVSVIPNPTSGYMTVWGASNATIRVYDLLGQLQAVAYNTERISIADLPPGLYIVLVSSSDGTPVCQARIVKE